MHPSIVPLIFRFSPLPPLCCFLYFFSSLVVLVITLICNGFFIHWNLSTQLSYISNILYYWSTFAPEKIHGQTPDKG